MTASSAVSGNSANTALQNLLGGTPSSGTGSNAQISQEQFLTLLTTQLQTQDPLHPLDNAEFFSQIAQLSTVSGIDQLNGTVNQLTSQLGSAQTLQAASLVGHKVFVASNSGYSNGNGFGGVVDATTSGPVSLRISDASGAVVRTIDLGVQQAGAVPFTWDGLANDGTIAPPGQYTLSAQSGKGSGAVAAGTEIAAQVSSVQLSSSGIVLNLGEFGDVDLSKITEIQ